MKDIDFDELDKAVNSLMASGGPATTPTETPETVISIPSTTSATVPSSPVAPQASVVQEAVVVNPVATTPVAAVATPPVAPAVRRGRFMDMVPNSSASPTRSLSTSAPSRQGLSITPRTDTPAPTAQPDETPEQAQPIITPSETPETAVSFDTMPDPIDTMPAEVTTTIPTADELQTESQIVSALDSPFLTDAKVEKRPLNSGLGLELEEAAKQETDADDAATTDSTTQIDSEADEPPITPQVPELNGELVAIESGDAIEVTQAVDTADAASQVDAPSAPLGATSIAQQYKAKESSGDQSHAAIYDAAQYPEPLNHPAKSKSGWLWVLWVIVLLGIGAGGAVLLYVLGIIP